MPDGHIDACHHAETGICICREESIRYQELTLYSLSLFFLETAGAIFTGSLALLSDALHTLFDSAESILSAIIANRARFVKNEVRLRKIGGVISAALIFAVSWFILEEALARLDGPGHLIGGWAIAFAGIAIGVNVLMYLKHEKAPDEHRNVTHAWQKLHIMTDLMASIAALVGTALAVFGVPMADAIVSIGIVAVIWIRITKYLLDMVFGKPDTDKSHHH
jgi:cobalt-zinc-cadmium efflux system protein